MGAVIKKLFQVDILGLFIDIILTGPAKHVADIICPRAEKDLLEPG